MVTHNIEVAKINTYARMQCFVFESFFFIELDQPPQRGTEETGKRVNSIKIITSLNLNLRILSSSFRIIFLNPAPPVHPRTNFR